MAYPEFLIDKRVVRRNIAKGIVEAKEYEKVLSQLPDVESNAQPSSPEPEADADGAAERATTAEE